MQKSCAVYIAPGKSTVPPQKSPEPVPAQSLFCPRTGKFSPAPLALINLDALRHTPPTVMAYLEGDVYLGVGWENDDIYRYNFKKKQLKRVQPTRPERRSPRFVALGKVV
jgi:hypothetical protein